MSNKTPEQIAWDEWFDKQYDLCGQIDRAIAGLSVGKDDMFRAALWSSVVEHGAECIRFYIPLAPTSVTPSVDEGLRESGD